jgi:NurA-like 5'-3' nuclease
METFKRTIRKIRYKMARIILKAYVKAKRKKRPGVHSKCRNTKQKTGKYYSGTPYRGQGR